MRHDLEYPDAERQFAAVFRDAPIGMCTFAFDPECRIVDVNAALSKLLGRSLEQLRENGRFDELGSVRAVVERLRAGRDSVAESDVVLHSAAGDAVECRATVSLVRDADGRAASAIAQFQPAQRELRQHIRRHELLLGLARRSGTAGSHAELATYAAATIEAALDVVAAPLLDARGVPRAPGDAAGVFALSPNGPEHLETARIPGHWRRRGASFGLSVPIGDGMRHSGWVVALADGERRFGEAERSFLEAVAQILGGAEDRIAAEERASRSALHDLVTGLPNRRLFADRAAIAVSRAARSREPLAIFCVDVDRFTYVNDALGHEAGDELLRALGDRLRGALRTCDSLARTGGDEFAILCERIMGERGAIEIAERIVAALAAPFFLAERDVHAAVSIGVVIGDGRPTTADALLRNADVALQRAKTRPGTAYELFDRAMRRRLSERIELERDLRRALDRDELVLHYQPLVSLAERRVIGVEALLRWQHPKLGMVSPATFIPVAEECGLIIEVGEYVLAAACRQLAHWSLDPSLPRIYMSVNVSGRQLAEPGLPGLVAQTLARTGVAPEQLALELTESVLMEETASPAAMLHELRALGVNLLLDDFGTGYSSLNHVKRFPLNAIKVDRSFVAGLEEDESGRHILRAIVSMASALDVTVIGEGVETLEQASWLASMGCGAAQGFGLARPAPAEVIEQLLRDGLPEERLQWSTEAPAGAPAPQQALAPLAAAAGGPTLPLSEAAQALGVSTSTLRRWANSGRIEAVRTPGGHRRFPVSEVRRVTTHTARPTLRTPPLPAAPLPELAGALGAVVAAAQRALYEADRAGWFGASGAQVVGGWTEAVAEACGDGSYEAALDATRRLAEQADYAAVSLLERHAFVERVGDLAVRHLQRLRAPSEAVVDAQRLFARLRAVVLSDET